MRAVDTNFLVRLLAKDDAAQLKAALTFLEKGVWVSHLVLVESVWVFSSYYERTASLVIEALEGLLQNDRISLQDPDVVRSALEHFRKRPSLGFSDCMMLEIARKAGHLPLGTFDRNLSKLPDATLISSAR